MYSQVSLPCDISVDTPDSNGIYLTNFPVKEILFTHWGRVDVSAIEGVLLSMDNFLARLRYGYAVIKRVRFLTVEMLQNLYHHADSPEYRAVEHRYPAFFALAVTRDERLLLRSSNVVTNAQREELTRRIAYLNDCTYPQLRALYRETLQNREFTSQGGGGLGLISIACKTVPHIGCEFHRINGSLSLYRLTVCVRDSSEECASRQSND